MSDLDGDLRALRVLLPEPDDASTARGREAMRRGVLRRQRVRWPRLLRGRRRTGLAIAVACLVLAGGALATVRWTTADVPAGGRGVYAFALPRTDILPGGYARTRPLRISELPTRPALLFPAGTSYATAIRDYYAVRERGGVVPAGVTLTDPLPAGKVVRVLANGRIALDPAAPVGYDLWTGLVSGFGQAPDGTFAPSLPRCQVILPSDDPSVPADCLGNPNRAAYVRAAGERWIASPTLVTPPTQIVGTTVLSVLARPRTSEDVLPGPLRRRGTSMPGHELQPEEARLALRTGGLRVFVVRAAEGWVCLQVYDPPAGTGGTCNPTDVLVTFGAIPLYQGAPGGRIRAIALVGDGFDTVTAPDGRSAPIVNNVFVIETVHGAKLTLSGAAGRHRISVFQ